MSSIGARGAAIVSMAVLAMGLYGSGVAGADYAGQKYGDVAKIFSGNHMTAVIATVVGDQLPMDDCIVTRWQLNNNDKTKGLLYLNCNEPVAAPGTPGNSAMSAEGKAAKLDQKRATNITKHPEQCQVSSTVDEWCTKLCERTGLCTYPASA